MNKWLIGNGHWCPTCGGTGRGLLPSVIEYKGGTFANLYDLCTTCLGEKRIVGPGPDVPRPAPSCMFDIIEYGRKP